jgi:TatD DNase family protein
MSILQTSTNDLQLVDSHCHLHHLDLAQWSGHLRGVFAEARAHDVSAFLCVSINKNDFSVLHLLAEQYPDVSISIGVHPNEPIEQAICVEELVHWGQSSRCVAIGETGLDYYRVSEPSSLTFQREQFTQHIQAARLLYKPLIIHTRDAAEDTINMLQGERADEVGGVMHCFVESYEIARRALDLNFYISFSGILTFKNATQLHDVAQRIPLNRILIETDSPYLAPHPFRGKQNHPALVSYVARALAKLRKESFEAIAEQTTQNFYRCFPLAKSST